jgi:uncharacterized membrane protein YfcA
MGGASFASFEFEFSRMTGFSPVTIVLLVVILAASALMSGLSGFGFSAIGALCLIILPPQLGVPLLMTLSAANQFMSLRQLKSDMKPINEWWPDGPAPYLLGGLVGVPVGLMILRSLPTTTLMAVVGGFLVVYAAYSLLKPISQRVALERDGIGRDRPIAESRSRLLELERVAGGKPVPTFPQPARGGSWLASSVVGLTGGVIGGFAAFPGAPVVVWSGLRRLPKQESRAIVQPYILGLQVIAILLLALQRPQTFDRAYWVLVAITIPVVLPCTLFGVALYRSLSDVNFRRITFLLLGVSGFGLLLKAATALGAMAQVRHVAGL